MVLLSLSLSLSLSLYYIYIDNGRFFSRQMLAKFAEDDRIEQMNAQKRRMRQLEHKRAVEKLIEERREQFKRERVRISYNLLRC